MSWIELSVETPREYAEPVSYLFARHGDRRVLIEETGGFNPDEGEKPISEATVVVRGYLLEDETVRHRRAAIEAGLKLIHHICALPPLDERRLNESVWERQEFEPVRIGRRLIIVPDNSWSGPDDGRIVVPLEPGMAFGTGHHPTTRMCLELIEENISNGDCVLDVGCGSGILSIAAVKLGAARVVGLDSDQDAILAAQNNAQMAGANQSISFKLGSLPCTEVPKECFDLVVANISASVLCRLAHELVACTSQKGVIIGSGVLEDRMPEVSQAFNSADAMISMERRSGDWLAFIATRAPRWD